MSQYSSMKADLVMGLTTLVQVDIGSEECYRLNISGSGLS